MESNFYTPKQFAELMGINRQTVYRWIEEGKLPAVRVGPRLVRIPKDAADATKETFLAEY